MCQGSLYSGELYEALANELSSSGPVDSLEAIDRSNTNAGITMAACIANRPVQTTTAPTSMGYHGYRGHSYDSDTSDSYSCASSPQGSLPIDSHQASLHTPPSSYYPHPMERSPSVFSQHPGSFNLSAASSNLQLHQYHRLSQSAVDSDRESPKPRPVKEVKVQRTPVDQTNMGTLPENDK